MKAVPADVGNFIRLGNNPLHRHHLAGEKAKPLPSAKLPALLKQKLHAQADAQNGLALGRFLPDHPVQPGPAELLRRVGKGPHPGEKEFIGPAEHRGSPGDHGVCPTASRERQREKRFPTP